VARLVFLLLPQLHLLDLAEPAQVFSTAADLGYRYELHYVADQPVAALTSSPPGTGRARRPGSPARWSSTPAATATSRR
jgi:hypothetical protein